MRNLKKVLSLVLCVAVMLSVMVLGTGAAFSDQDKIENTEAVDACSALNIIGGYEDGSFHPERNIKRSEITKMICVALNGGQEPNVGTNEVPTFTDVRGTADAWAEGYIESCVAQGIVSGVGGGRFSPAGNVTGSQLAKMLLVCLGYNSDNEGFTGNAWETNVNVRAAQKGLYAGLSSMDTSAAVTRDQAAQMVWNALNAYEVEYKTNLITDANGNLVTQITVQDKVVGNNNDKITLLKDKYNAWVNVGTLSEIDGSSITITMTTADESVSDFVDETNHEVTFTKVGVDYSSLMGQKVKVMFKDGKTNEVLGVYATDDNTIYTVNANAVEANGTNKIKFNDTTYNVELKGDTGSAGSGTTALLTYIDGAAANGYTIANLDAMNTSANVLTFVDTDGNNKIDSVYVKTVTVAKVTYASSTQIVAGGKTYKMADENIVDGLAKDDWVIVTENAYNDNKDIVKADKIETTIGGYKAPANGDPAQYKIDGTWYNTYNGVKLDADASDTAEVVVVNGIVFYADKVSGTADSLDVALVVDTGSFNQAKLAFVDGTTKTVAIDTDGEDPTPGTVYCYEVDGEEYKLSPITDLDNDDYTLIANGSDTLDATASASDDYAENVGTTAIDDNAKVILWAQNDNNVRSFKLITGKQFKTINWTTDSGKKVLDTPNNDALAALTSTVAGIKKVSVLFVNIGKNMPDAFQSNTNYAYVVEGSYTYSSDYIAYSIFDGTNTIEVTEKTNKARSVGDIIGYETIEDGVIKDVTLYNNTGYSVGALIGIDADGKGFTVNGSDHYNVTADTKVILINSDDNGDQVGVPGDALTPDYEADEIGDSGEYYLNAKYILDGSPADDADVNVIVVDVVNNKLADVTQPVAVETATPTAADINNALTAAGANGTVVVTGTLPTSSVQQILAGQTLVITSQQSAVAVQALTAAENATIELQVATSDNYNTSSGTKFADGSNAELTAAAIPAGKYVWTANAISSTIAAFDKQ